jgi:hypothetical protein
VFSVCEKSPQVVCAEERTISHSNGPCSRASTAKLINLRTMEKTCERGSFLVLRFLDGGNVVKKIQPPFTLDAIIEKINANCGT